MGLKNAQMENTHMHITIDAQQESKKTDALSFPSFFYRDLVHFHFVRMALHPASNNAMLKRI